MTASAQGKDFSSYQPALKVADLKGLSFAFARVSDWVGQFDSIDVNFPVNWGVMREAKVHRGAYWYLQSAPGFPGAKAQAEKFANAVHREGLLPGDMMVCDSELVTENADSYTQTFCNEVTALLGRMYPMIIYTNHNAGQHLIHCAKWPVWFALPQDTAPDAALLKPWSEWKFWQWGTVGGVDADAFNGTAAELQSWLNQYVAYKEPE